VKISFNSYIAILIAIALIGILFVPAVSAGKIINYGPIQGTVKTIPVVNFTPATSVITQKVTPFTYSPSKWSNTTLSKPTSNNGGNFGGFTIPSPIVTPAEDPSYISKEEAIQIAIESFTNISITSDPVARLTTRQVTDTEIKPVWVVELSGISTDPKAFGSHWYRNAKTGEEIFVPTHSGGYVWIDAITGAVISVEKCL